MTLSLPGVTSLCLARYEACLFFEHCSYKYHYKQANSQQGFTNWLQNRRKASYG